MKIQGLKVTFLSGSQEITANLNQTSQLYFRWKEGESEKNLTVNIDHLKAMLKFLEDNSAQQEAK